MPKIVAELYRVGTVKEVEGDIATIEILPEYAEALYMIETQDYLDILFWIPVSRDVLKVHPSGNPENPIRGVFSTRSPARPNNIGVTRVKLLERRENIIKVSGLDAFKGTAIIDIKNSRGTGHGKGHH